MHPLAWRAALRVFERAFGRPVDVVDVSSSERSLLIVRVLEQHPHLAELVPLRLRATGEPEQGYPLEPD